MAKNKKKQREERLQKEKLAKEQAALAPPVVEAPPEPPQPEPPKVKLPKKRYVRPPRQVRPAKTVDLPRGNSLAARVMSSKAAKTFAEAPDESKAAGLPFISR